MKLPSAVKSLIHTLSELPSIGPRQATRLVFHLITRGPAAIRTLADDLHSLESIKVCERCFFPTFGSGPRPAPTLTSGPPTDGRSVGVIHQNQGTLCEICSNPARDQRVIMVVEKETDLISLEGTGKYKGRYLVLGTIPRTGLLEDAQKLRLQSLKKTIERDFAGKAEEIILGFSPTHIGDFNASLILRELSPLAKKTTRLGRGLPTGGEIEFADDETLGSALERRG
jgi:recombination protein RecR